jgi:hypothetical protein
VQYLFEIYLLYKLSLVNTITVDIKVVRLPTGNRSKVKALQECGQRFQAFKREADGFLASKYAVFTSSYLFTLFSNGRSTHDDSRVLAILTSGFLCTRL